MRFWTLAELKTKIQDDCDLEGEEFIDDTELVALINAAIDEVEQEIHALNQDYFLKAGSVIALVSGTSDYDVPSDIFGTKIRELVYDNGSRVYEIKRSRQRGKFTDYRKALQTSSSSAEYEYFLLNSTAGSPKIRLTPTPAESGSYLYPFYIRNANRLTVDADVLDIPEAANYVMKCVKVDVYTKEGDPRLQLAIQARDAEWDSIMSVLAEATADDDNEIEPDLSAYQEME